MSKGAVGLTAGYWPEDIYRYLATPGISLDEGLVTRPGRKQPDHPALISYEAMLSYRQLATETDAAMKAILTCLEGKGNRIAIAMKHSMNLVKILLGALKGRCIVFLMNPSLAAEELGSHLSQFGPDLVVMDDGSRQKIETVGGTVPIVSFQALQAIRPTVSAPRGRQDLQASAVTLPADGGIVYHSHKSLLAGAISWSTFVPLKAEDLFLCLQPLHTWEGLYSLFPILFRGGTCLLADLEDPEKTAQAVRSHRPVYTILPRPEARKLYESSYRPLVHAFREILQGLFVSVLGPFTAIGRRRLRGLLERPALLTYGSAEAGAVFSSHPTWYLDAAVGIPLTNVDVWPLNPATGNPLEVPWEAIEYGEVGVKSPMTAVDYQSAEEKERRLKGGWLRTKIVATMDPNGLFYIQSTVRD